VQHVEEALRRQPQEVLDARLQRHKRAMDLSMKHTALPKELQAKQTPFAYYLQDELAKVRAEEAERFALGAGRFKDREIP
jgi:ubiquinol-cytochrome c reductase subunit 7